MRAVLAIALLASACVSRPMTKSCPIPGEAIQWQADYCLSVSETDDIIAAQPCMDRESLQGPADDCVRKAHYKRALCRQAVDDGRWKGTVETCFADPAFSGTTVRNGGL